MATSASEVRADDDEVDSTLGEDATTLTESLRSSLLESVRENGRGYHRFDRTVDGNYWLPEDEMEQARLVLQHELWFRTFGGRLFTSPIKKEKIKQVLDLGTGTGIWAIEMADAHPSATVTGVDLSPIQPNYVPPNLKFEIDDFNNDWTFTQKFDLIVGRCLVGASGNYPRLFQQALTYLSPNGYLEMIDIEGIITSDDDTHVSTAAEAWSARQQEAMRRVDRDPHAPAKYAAWMREVGFVDVEERRYKWPVGSWPKDKYYKDIGRMHGVNFLAGLEGFTLRLWTGVLGLSLEETQVALVNVRKDVKNPRIHLYWPV
ncbi:uncharacterized protein HMPREF1541_05472 [Cyphellophora europaea CBS 101466]|uniref:Methyltransferase domain-containing protein n=1 Tax=Cyphellophora europaea (strain CBS 101466) TaxID=1220924 RepID=W2RU54_CYPE1|nr:uncharacterized protein HMPREF1541_05472 [Cyphellophora europaea CBS 101466]ETN39249.1 hypothetical protein HMPREF1541_05472 [Cyphellophora europaea CBS 101466]